MGGLIRITAAEASTPTRDAISSLPSRPSLGGFFLLLLRLVPRRDGAAGRWCSWAHRRAPARVAGARPTGVGGWSAAGREGPGFRHASGFDPWVRAPFASLRTFLASRLQVGYYSSSQIRCELRDGAARVLLGHVSRTALYKVDPDPLSASPPSHAS